MSIAVISSRRILVAVAPLSAVVLSRLVSAGELDLDLGSEPFGRLVVQVLNATLGLLRVSGADEPGALLLALVRR